MNEYGFTSVFASRLAEYVTFKHAMGVTGTSRIWYLRRFDAHCAAGGLTTFDRDTVEGWVGLRLQTSGRYRSWMSYIRDFGRWLRINGDDSAYVLSDRWKAEFVPAHPYLLSRREIDAFFTTAPQVKADSPWAWQATAFFTLMHSCGLRTGEVRALTREQVDTDSGHVDIIWAKGQRDRRLPITEEIVNILTDCDDRACVRFPGRETFFVSNTGGPVYPAAVGVMFGRIWDQAGLPRPAGGQKPRPYDFRHHFAYANIERWGRDGTDVTAMLPYLSRYMGHASFDSTYYYIHTSPDFMNAYTQITGDSQHILPEVGFE